MIEPIPLVDLSGGPYERGVSYGRQAKVRIHRSIAQYIGKIAATLSREEIDRFVHDYLPIIEAFDAAYVTEMRGIAEGAEVRFEDVVLVNARTEILKKAETRRSKEEMEPDGCTSVVVMAEATRDGRLIHAQNWDWLRDCVDTSVILRIRRDDGPDILTFTEAGGLARSGLNEAGISITANYLESDRDYTQTGVPLSLLRRKVLENEYLALAMNAVYATPKSASNNMTVCQAEGVAISFECAPDETFQILPTEGMIVHANHWQSPVALSKLRDTGIASTPDSLYRDVRLRALLQRHVGDITAETVKEALLDRYQEPWSICRPPRLSLSGNTVATVITIVMDPAAGRIDVAPLPALGGTFTTYMLNGESKANVAEAE